MAPRRDGELTWHQSLGTEGYKEAQLTRGAPMLPMADERGSILLCDMTGDGLTDIVWVGSGNVTFWPNLGHGEFGQRVIMSNAPLLGQEFSTLRIRMADVTGFGGTDMIYIPPQGGAWVYYNQWGNGWSDGHYLSVLPQLDTFCSVDVFDIAGRGTQCLCWTTDYPGYNANAASTTVYFMDLMNGSKPGLLVKGSNGMGSESSVRYRSSIQYYLDDERSGAPWATRLPFSINCVQTITSVDRISHTSSAMQYYYHNGYYDFVDRQFRGFQMVEQRDMEEFATDRPERTFKRPSVVTKSWFFTGLQDLDDISVLPHSLDTQTLKQHILSSAKVQEDITVEEKREAYAALSGQPRRQEIYSEDASAQSSLPYVISQQTYEVVLVQGRSVRLHDTQQRGTFRVNHREEMASNYERKASDMRVQHTLTLKTDDYGNVQRSAIISYGKSESSLPRQEDRQKQMETVIHYTESDYTNPIVDQPDYFQIPVLAEATDYRIYPGLSLQKAIVTQGRYDWEVVAANQCKLFREAADIPIHEDAVEWVRKMGPEGCKALVSKSRTLYYQGDLKAPLPRCKLEPFSIKYQSYQLAFTKALLAKTLRNDQTSFLPEPEAEFQMGGYVNLDGEYEWWAPSHRDSFMDDEGHDELSNARSQFYIPNLTVDQFENKWRRWIDRYNLLFQRSRDAIGNFTSSVHDYACLQPAQVTDENGNTALHASDALGRSVGVAFTGKDNEAVGDSLDNFQSEVDDKDLNELMQNPSGPVAARVLANSGKRTIYALDQYAKHHAPGCSVELVRDTHHRDGPTQISVTITYLNGDGQAIQTVTLQPDGKWLLSGYTIHDHKGQPVRQYLPFFNASHDYHFPDTATVATTILYDGIGRVAGFLNGNQTWSKTRFSPWDQVLFDAGDTILIEKPQNDADIGGLFRCLDSGSYSLPWYYRRINDSSSSDQQKAALKSKQYNDTPKTVHMNAMGKEILTQLDNGPTDPSRIRETRTDYDEHGNISCQMDALGRVVAKTQYDMLGRPLCSSNMDSGKRWQLPDCVGSPHLSWRNGGTRKRIVYDALRRTKQIKLKPSQPSTASEVIVIENVYGEDCEDSSKNNLRGRLYQCRDQSGKQTNNRFDFKGNCCESSVQYAQEYRQLLDWSKGDAILLEPGVYRTGASFDAVGHTLQSKVSNGLKVKRIYDVAGRLTGLDSIDPDGTSTSSVSSVEYTEDGNIASIRYANGSQTTHAYDLVTRKLVNTRITKGNKKTVQDIFYTHDCVGRVIQQADKAQESIYFQNNVVPPVQEFWFDPLGQLTKATGREQVNVADGGQKQLLPHGAAPGRQNALSGNNKYVVQYEEIYQYDCAGNILQTRHAPLSNNEYSGWARKYQYNEPSSIDSAAVSNRLSSTSIGNTVDKYGYDNSEAGRAGCMTSISGYSSLYWDFDNHLSSFSTQRVPGDSIPETAWYIYNSSGRRVRKVTDRATIASQGSSSPSSPNKCKETLYLPLCDIFTTYRGDGSTVIREICTTDLGDPTISRTPIAMLETTKQIQDGTEQSLIRYQMSGKLELDDEGNIVSYEEYSPYGSSTYHVWHSGAPRKYRFASYQRDSESGLYLCGERYYACWIGRWTSADPLGTIAGLNVYCYADNDPVNLEDHKGTCPTRAKRPRMGSEQQPSGSGASSPLTSRGPLAGKKAANGIKGAKETFSKGDFDAAFWSTSNQDIKAKDREQMDGSTSIFRSWQEVHKTPVGVEGLHGCTSLILTSDEGVYFTHWWETRGFSETRPEEGNPKEVPYDHEGEFKSQVLNALEEGRKKGESTHYESLTEHSDMTNVRGYWMTPKEKGSTLYPGKIDEIKAKVEGIIQSEITWVDTSYVPVQNPDDLDEPKNINRLAGQALVTYNPGAEWPVDIFVENRLFQEKR